MDKLQKKIYELTKVFYSADAGPLSANKAAALKYARFIYFIVKQYTDGDLTLRATSLVYTTLLSIVPFIAVTFSVLKGFGVHDMAEPILERMLAPLGDQSIEIAGRITMFVDNMKVGVLGSIGLSLLIYTVISLIAKIEEGLNYIWRVRSPRSMARRFSDYMSVLLVGPILIFSAIGLTAAIKSNTVVACFPTACWDDTGLARPPGPVHHNMRRIHLHLRLHAQHPGKVHLGTRWGRFRRGYLGVVRLGLCHLCSKVHKLFGGILRPCHPYSFHALAVP
jgi:hypothetical protein